MMAFSDEQTKLLSAKLSEKFVKTRTQEGRALSSVEGWHAIAEANRIFGFDGWDRETLDAKCIWQDGKRKPKASPSVERLKALWARNAGTVSHLRAALPELKTVNGMHYSDVLAVPAARGTTGGCQ